MKVELLHNTPLFITDQAIGKCWDKCSAVGLINEKRMHRVGNKFKHASTLEHITYNFDISGISRALLQELARHRIASMSVKSSRYTLGELKDVAPFIEKYGHLIVDKDHNYINEDGVLASDFVVLTGQPDVDSQIIRHLEDLRVLLTKGISNDLVKYCMPEAYKTSLVWSINMRSLQNFIALRTNKSALWEIRELAAAVYKTLPEDHQFMFVESLDYLYHGAWEEDLIQEIGEWYDAS